MHPAAQPCVAGGRHTAQPRSQPCGQLGVASAAREPRSTAAAQWPNYNLHPALTCHCSCFLCSGPAAHGSYTRAVLQRQTLVDAENDPQRYGWPVTKYPDCVSCHVVGYGQESGFISAEKTDHLTDVGCERCHGPGLDHVTSGGAKKLGIIGGVTPSVMCTQCHDYEQSPEFVYGDRWKVIEHGKEPK